MNSRALTYIFNETCFSISLSLHRFLRNLPCVYQVSSVRNLERDGNVLTNISGIDEDVYTNSGTF